MYERGGKTSLQCNSSERWEKRIEEEEKKSVYTRSILMDTHIQRAVLHKKALF